jgi:light-regulated signal transduction histidine kinase (bacteriophytochrome)
LVKKRLGEGIHKDEINFLNRLLSAAERVRILISDVLTYYIIPFSDRNFGPVDLNLLVNEVLHDMENNLQEKKAIVNVDKLYPITEMLNN